MHKQIHDPVRCENVKTPGEAAAGPERRILASCTLCGRRCGVDRTAGDRGACGAGRLPRVARWLPHQGEEPPLAGEHGSGTIFFTGCSLHCLFCQNAEISQRGLGAEIPVRGLAEIMLELQVQGCHNVNLVSPTPYVPQIAEALRRARAAGLSIPVVYNTHGYDSPEALECMRGAVDVYLPDVKYAEDAVGSRLSGVDGYVARNLDALARMFEQVGHLRLTDGDGLAVRGLWVRILVLPDNLEGSRVSLRRLRGLFGPELALSLMAQYTPLEGAATRPPLDRTVRPREYERVVEHAVDLGFERIWAQEPSSAHLGVPDFHAAQPFRFEDIGRAGEAATFQERKDP